MNLRFYAVRWLLLVGMTLLMLVPRGWGLDPGRSLAQYGRQVWQTDNGLPQNTVRAVLQARDGYLWIGTDDGLVRFDGSEFKVFTAENTPELPGNSIQKLTEDSSGRLWVITPGGLTVYERNREGNRFRQIGVADGLPDAAIWFVHEDHRGRVWVATASGLCLMSGRRCSAVAATRGMSLNREENFAEGPDGSVWLADGAETVQLDGASLERRAVLKTTGSPEILVQHVDRQGRLLVGTPDGLQVARRGLLSPVAIAGVNGHVAVRAMVEGADGRMWLGTSAGVVQGSGETFQVLEPGAALAAKPVQMLFQDREGSIWVGMERGVARIVGDRLDMFRASDALAGSAVLSIAEDREGDLWLGTESDGLTMLHEQTFTTYTTADGMSGNVIRSVLQDAAGTVWVGTDGAGLNRRAPEGDGFVSFTTREGLSSDVILSLASAANGDLWVGTPTGLNLIRKEGGRRDLGSHVRKSGHGAPGRVTVFTTADGLADDFIRSLLVDGKGNVWVGTRHGLTRIASAEDGQVGMTTFTTLDGLGSDYIGVMVQAHDGDLWIGTSGGLTRLHDGRFTSSQVKGGLAKNVVTAIFEQRGEEDAAGTVWLGSNGGGLSRMRGGEIVPVPATNLPEAISGVLEDGEKRLWIGSRSGIFRVAESELERVIAQGGGTVALSAYDTTDGMRVRECSSGGHPAVARTRDGSLWFATLRGVSVVNPERLHENKTAPLVAIETVLVNDVPRELVRRLVQGGAAHGGGGELTLAPGSQRVEFQYAGLSFAAPQKVRYRYKLDGFDRDWVDAGARRAAFYTNLRPGQYVFRVAAANNDGVWSVSDATMALRVRPFFWQTLWFYALLILMLAGLAYLIYAWRVRSVEMLYAGVMEERNRLAREIHDTLAQGIVSISLQLEVATRLLGSSAGTAGTEAARAQLDETRALVRQSLADARSSIWDLRAGSGTAEAEELPARVGRTLKTLTDSSDIAGKLHVTGTYRSMNRLLEDELLRIAQEAVTNAVWHAVCTQVEVTLTYEMKAFRLVVRDDGRGFDTRIAGPAGHFGVQGMRERAAKIHARLEVESEVGRGTQVRVELSLV